MFGRYQLRRTTLLSIILVTFLLGLALPRLSLTALQTTIVYLCIGLVGLYVLLKRKNGAVFVLLIVAALLLGIWRGSAFDERVDQYQTYIGRPITLRVTAREDSVYSERRQLIFSATNIQLIKPHPAKLVGNLEIEGFGVPMVYRGDTVEVTGKMFPKRGDNVAGVSFAQISSIKKDNSFVNKARREFSAGLQNALPEPMASFALGILIGQRNTLPEELKNQLTIVGLIHIVAVSGYNVTIIINASKRLFERRSRYQAMVVSITLILVFLLLTGSSPSIIRAAVVSSIGLVMWYFGRAIKPTVLLLLAASLTAGINPLYLWSSIGWYLSFTAFFGVLVLAPLLHQRLFKPKLHDKLLPQTLTETLAAQLCTLPIILFVFGRLSIISVLANLLVVPMIPLAMLASLVAGLYGMIGPIVFGGVLVVPARLTLDYVLSFTEVLSRIPFANVPFSITSTQMTVLYILIAVISYALFISQRRRLELHRLKNMV